MKEIFKSLFSLFILILIAVLIYVLWIFNKGQFKSQYLEDFINNKFKSEEFYTSIHDPVIKFDFKEKKIIIDGQNFNIFSTDENKIAEFENLKVYIDFIPLITKKRLDTNQIEMLHGEINVPTVFSKPLNVTNIELSGNLYPTNGKIKISNFSTIINNDEYIGSSDIDLTNLEAKGSLTKLLRKNIFYGMNLESNSMDFTINKEKFTIEGSAVLGGVDISLIGIKNYINKEKYISKYDISGIINDQDIKKSFGFEVEQYLKGLINLNATYFIYPGNKEKIKTSNDLKESILSFSFLDLSKEEGVDANADIEFNFLKGDLTDLKIVNYEEGNKKMNGLIEFSKKHKPYKNLELSFEKDSKKINIKILKDNKMNKLSLFGDYFDFSQTLKDTFVNDKKEDSFLTKLQPVQVNLNAKEISVSKENSIFNVEANMQFDKKIFQNAKIKSSLKNSKEFELEIIPKNNSRELVINSNDAGLFLKTFNINKSGEEGELVLHGHYDDTLNSHPLDADVTIRDMKLVKAPTLATILNLASIGIVSALSGEGIMINKLKSEFVLENGVLNLKKYEAYGPDIGFSNQGNVYLKDQKIDLEGAIVPMVTLNKIIGSIPVLGKILTNERKGIWSFAYTVKGNLEKPDVMVDPIKTITPGFIQKFFSVFKAEDKDKNNSQESNEEDAEN